MSARFLIDGGRVRQLAATRQGRVSLGGFAYQIGYAVARLASLYTRRPVLDIDGIPTLLRFDWAEDLDEIETDGTVVLTQCKRIADIGQAGTLADVLLGFAPKWLWTPEDRRPALRFRLVCTDPRFAGFGPTPLGLYEPRPGESDRDAVLRAAIAQLQISPGSKSDRFLWQSNAEAFGFSRLCEALWDQTEVLYLPVEVVADDPAGPLFRAEQNALALLVRMQVVAADQQRLALAALRTLLHANVVEFDPTGTRPMPGLDREPRILSFDDVYYSLFEFQPSFEERPPFQVMTRQVLEEEAAKPKQLFVARRPRWSDVVHGQNEEIRFLERDITDQVFALVSKELLGKLDTGAALPMLFVLGAPGAGKSTLVLRVATRLVQEGFAVVAAPKLNLDSIEEDEVEPFLQALARLEEGSLPVLLVLDDPFFAESGWVDLLRRLGKMSRRVAVLGASPEYLYREFGYALAGRQVDCRTLLLPRPLEIERRALAQLHGRDPEVFAKREEDFLVLVMEASAGISFDTIIDRIWMTLNHGLPINPNIYPQDLPWTVRAYLVACYFHRFYLRCPEILMRAILSHSGQDQPEGRIEYELGRLFDEHGWSIFSLEEPKAGQRFLGIGIGASHARVAVEAWRRRPVPAFDAGKWVIQASLHAQAAAMEIGNLAVRIREETQGTGIDFLGELISLWNQAAKAGELEARSLCLLHAVLASQAGPGQASQLRPGLEACVDRGDGQSWLAVLALTREPGSVFSEKEHLTRDSIIPELIRVADFHLATGRAVKFMDIFKNYPAIYAAVFDRFLGTDLIHPQVYQLLAPLMAANPGDKVVRKRVTDWIESNQGYAQVYNLLAPLVSANPGDEAVRNLATDWIESNQGHAQVYNLLAPLVATSPGDEAVRKLATNWIESNQGHPQVYSLLAPLVAANPEDEVVRKLATDWIELNHDHPQVYQLLATLVAANPGDEAVRKLATDWIESNQDHPQVYQLLAPLVVANPGDEAVRKLATNWMELNHGHPQVYQLLATLVAASPEDKALRKRAIYWIKDNFERAQTIHLLTTLIARSDGADDVLRLGEMFLANPLRLGRARIVSVLLTGSKASSRYIDLALDYLDEENSGARGLVLKHLAKAAATNLSAVLVYVAGCADEMRKKTVLRSIAVGIQRRPQALEALLDGRMEVLSFEDANALIARLLDEGILAEELLRFIIVRLASCFRRRGYGFLLRAVQRNPAARDGILALLDLDPRVRLDLSANGRA